MEVATSRREHSNIQIQQQKETRKKAKVDMSSFLTREVQGPCIMSISPEAVEKMMDREMMRFQASTDKG